MTEIRKKWLDPDFRRMPPHGAYCIICQRAIKQANTVREVLYFRDEFEAIHTDDWDKARASGQILEDIDIIGPDCAKRLGHEWSRPISDETARKQGIGRLK